MGVLVDLESKRDERRRRDVLRDMLISMPAGECAGCGALRSTVSIMHDSGTAVEITLVTVPHYRCDGEKVISQEPTLEDLEAKEAERDRTRQTEANRGRPDEC